MAEFRMPSLGSDMQAGTLVEWRVKPGDRVKRRDVIAVVETDKAAIEIEVYEDGIVETLLVQPGQKVAVGTVMAVIRTEDASTSPTGDKAPLEGPAQAPAEKVGPPATTVPSPGKEIGPPPLESGDAIRIKASPYARRLAAERGADLRALTGTGPAGAIRAADVRKASAAVPSGAAVHPAPEPIRETAATDRAAGKDSAAAMRRAIAAAMARSKREIPHYYLQTRINMRRTLQWLEGENLKRPIKDRILPVVPLIRAVALALKEVPELNGYWLENRLQVSEAIHIGFAIALRQGGLIAPALLDADEKGIDALMAALRDLIGRARAGGLRSSEMTDATVTVTNLGDLGVETVFGIIYPPQVALVGFGATMEQPWAENGLLGVRPVVTATLSADHRATDGHRGARFLEALNRYLQEPSQL
jgi:pyruvate dehydrogenase E2 component (dihydrolipoamide acetyltransferase)